ncbi:MAG: corrinoid protein [Candidatus Omnitrophota bacterium]
MAKNEKLYKAILEGDAKTSVETTKEALAAGIAPLEVVTETMVPAMDEVGRRFECEEFFIPELMIAARAMKQAMELIQPLLKASGAEPIGRVVIGTVKGDLHDIGKNLVASMLEGGGFEVTDLGVDVKPDQIISAISEKKAGLVCLSTLLTTTMPSMATTINALKEAGVRDRVKVMIGGAPITQQYADEIGADGYGENARTAVTLARRLAAG